METEKLSAAFCKKTTNPGRYNDGRGLYLLVKPNGGKSWVFRFRDRLTGKQQDMGLGPFGPHDVTLADARIKAGKYRAMLRGSADSPPANPIEERRRALQEAKLAHARRLTFKQCADRYIEANKASWKNPKHAAQWPSTLNTYAGDLKPLPVDEIDTAMVLNVLQQKIEVPVIDPETRKPIKDPKTGKTKTEKKSLWEARTETATRVRQRIERVLNWATSRKFREGENPARWRGHLENLLPKPTKLKKVQPRAALPYPEIGEFVAEIRQRDGLAAKAIELQILTATRPGETMGATWDEIDLKARTWTIPAERMKADKEHEIPLSDRAVKIIEGLPRVRNCDFLFPGQSLKKPMTTAAGMKLVKAIKPGITAHGFRSTFRDWAADHTAHARETIEHALAHQLKDKAEAAYKRSTELPKRKRLMNDWAKFCDLPASSGDNVTAIRKGAKA